MNVAKEQLIKYWPTAETDLTARQQIKIYAAMFGFAEYLLEKRNLPETQNEATHYFTPEIHGSPLCVCGKYQPDKIHIPISPSPK